MSVLWSLLFGLISWSIPVACLINYKKAGSKVWIILSLVSVSSCAVSLCAEVFYIKHRVDIYDWSALMDTVPTFSFLSAVLLLGTIALNIIMAAVYLIKRK